jgi:hypothetical protein
LRNVRLESMSCSLMRLSQTPCCQWNERNNWGTRRYRDTSTGLHPLSGEAAADDEKLRVALATGESKRHA